MYELVVGEPLFEGKTEYLIIDKIQSGKFSLSKIKDPVLKRLLRQMLHLNYKKRICTYFDFLFLFSKQFMELHSQNTTKDARNNQLRISKYT